MISPAHSENYDESDYNGESTLFVEWREKVCRVAQSVGKEVGFENVVINVFGTWGYTDRIGTIRLWMNGCQVIRHLDDETVARFQVGDVGDCEMLLRELLPQLAASATEETKQISAKFALVQEQERIEAELKALEAAKKAEEAAKKIEQHKALTPEQIKADWAAKVAAAKVAAEKDSKRPILRKKR